MSILSYNISDKLEKNLKRIDLLRSKIYTLPLPLKIENHLIWEADMDRIYWSLNLAKVSMNKSVLGDILSKEKKNHSPEERQILDYRNALNFIKFDWTGSPAAVTPSTFKKIYDLAFGRSFGPGTRNFNSKKKDVATFLEYLQKGNEHPVVKAGIAYIQTYLTSPFPEVAGRFSRLATYLFLYKFRYDMRNMLVFDEFLRKDILSLRETRETVEKYKTMTLWLEYFTYAVGIQTEKALKTMEERNYKTTIPSSFWNINERQKKILSLLNNPEEKVTNRLIQKRLGASQATCARDLKKLSSLGLILSHAKGRSIFYTKGAAI